MKAVGKGIRLSELIERLKQYAEVKEVDLDTLGNIPLVVFDTTEIKSSPFDGLYISPWEFKIKRDLIYSYAVDPVDDKRIRVYLFLKKGAVIVDYQTSQVAGNAVLSQQGTK